MNVSHIWRKIYQTASDMTKQQKAVYHNRVVFTVLNKINLSLDKIKLDNCFYTYTHEDITSSMLSIKVNYSRYKSKILCVVRHWSHLCDHKVKQFHCLIHWTCSKLKDI